MIHWSALPLDPRLSLFSDGRHFWCVQQEVAWKRVKQLAEEDVQVTVHVLSLNKGGLMVALHGLQGFVPISHLPAGAVSQLL